MNRLSFINDTKGIFSFLILGIIAFSLLASSVTKAHSSGSLRQIFTSDTDKNNYDHRWHKSDRELIDNLQINKSKFNRLLAMAEEDKDLVFISLTKVKLDTYLKKHVQPVSQTRIAEYRKLFRKLGLAEIRIYWNEKTSKPDLVEFFPPAYSRIEKRPHSNNVEHFSYKGYSWRTVNLETSTESLDKYQDETNLNDTKTRRIDKNWALTYFSGTNQLEVGQ